MLKRYKEWCVAETGKPDEVSSYTVQNLCKRLRQYFDKNVLAIKAETTKRTVVWKHGSYTYEEALKMADENYQAMMETIRNCAMALRAEILSSEKSTIEEPVTVKKILEGEVRPPKILKKFYQILYTGTDSDDACLSSKRSRLIDSGAADTVFACSGGKLIPGKQLSLGFVMKSMTGSKGVVTLLNKLGHCASNETIRRIDLGLEETLQRDNTYVPTDLKRQPGLCLSIAWDNFDVNLETPSGSDTIHHTYGVCYQNETNEAVSANAEVRPSSSNQQEHLPSGGKRKKSRFTKVSEREEPAIEPYYKKPKMTSFFFNCIPMFPPETFSSSMLIDVLWMMSFNRSEDTPAWTGWNCRRYVETLPKQSVLYMKHIQLPPTRIDVVRETLRRSLAVARECGDQFAIVSYDLAIAKIAKQLQVEEAPEFDDLFIQFGQFHIALSFLSSLGHIIEGSGGPYILIEAGLVAPGSMNKFLKGKMYNRCRRGHVSLSTAMHGLHFERFVEDVYIQPSTIDLLNDWSNNQLSNTPPEELEYLATQYDMFLESTLQGERGKTAQYWMGYSKLIDLFLIMQRAVKANDIDQFAYILHEITSIFFVTNHQNYARWMSLYSLELANLQSKRPVIFDALSGGAFSVNRTGNAFARVGTDMALEQTINAHAKSRLKGIMQYADVQSAVNRWLVTSSMKAQLTNTILDYAEMKSSNEQNKHLRSKHIHKETTNLNNLKNTIKSMLNPFLKDIHKDVLFNIKTGRQASASVENYLLTAKKVGDEKRDQFVQECQDDANRFEKSISKTKIVNFATENFKAKNKSTKAGEVVSAKGTRDLFGRLLYLCVTHNIDLSKVLEYPLLPEPPCFTHPDGTIRSGNKSAVLHLLKAKVKTIPPKKVDVAIIDGMFILKSTLKESSATFGTFAKKVLTKALKMTSHRADLCFDVYTSPSIKDIKRQDRGDAETASIFSFGPKQKMPSDIKNLMLLSEFKKELLRFLYHEFENQEFESLIGDKVLYCSVDNECKRFTSLDGQVKVEEVPELYGEHLEADTRVMFHAKHADSHDPGNLIIRGTDTDICVVLLSNAHKLQMSHLWYDTGLDHDNSRCYIDITKLSNDLSICNALPGLYAFTGCDYTPFFFRKGKVKPIEIMEKQQKFIDAFMVLGEEGLNEEICDAIDEYTCHLYGYRKHKHVDDALKCHFDKKCKPSATGKPFSTIKNVDPTTFMPCKRVLLQQIKRAWYTACLYKTASEAYPAVDLSPIDYG